MELEENLSDTQDMESNDNQKNLEINFNVEVFDLTDDEPRLLGVIDKAEVIIGREQSNCIGVPNRAISRQHGMFLVFNDLLFYKDLGSTNGSWCNGEVVNAGQIKLLRFGDILQLANTPIRIGKEEDSVKMNEKPLVRSLIILKGNELYKEVIIPDYGRALVVGGKQSDIVVEGGDTELSALIVERRGDSVSAFGLSRKTKAEYNGRLLTDALSIYDADELRVGEYTIILNDLSSKRAPKQGEESALVDMPPEALMYNPVGAHSFMQERIAIEHQNQDLNPEKYESGNYVKPDWSKLERNSTETMAFDPEISKKFKVRSGDSSPGARNAFNGITTKSGKRVPLPAFGTMEAWLAGFTVLCLLMCVFVIIYMFLFT